MDKDISIIAIEFDNQIFINFVSIKKIVDEQVNKIIGEQINFKKKPSSEQKTEPDTKVCARCKVTKNISEFYKDKYSADGYLYRCKECDREYQKTRHKGKDKKIVEHQVKEPGLIIAHSQGKPIKQKIYDDIRAVFKDGSFHSRQELENIIRVHYPNFDTKRTVPAITGAYINYVGKTMRLEKNRVGKYVYFKAVPKIINHKAKTMSNTKIISSDVPLTNRDVIKKITNLRKGA